VAISYPSEASEMGLCFLKLTQPLASSLLTILLTVGLLTESLWLRQNVFAFLLRDGINGFKVVFLGL